MCESCYEERITAEFGKVRLAGFDKALPPYQVLRLANDVYFQLGKPGSALRLEGVRHAIYYAMLC